MILYRGEVFLGSSLYEDLEQLWYGMEEATLSDLAPDMYGELQVSLGMSLSTRYLWSDLNDLWKYGNEGLAPLVYCMADRSHSRALYVQFLVCFTERICRPCAAYAEAAFGASRLAAVRAYPYS